MTVAPVDRAAIPVPGFLIGGEKITRHSGDFHEHRYAATGEITNEVPMAGQVEIDRAVAAARAVFPSWKRMPGNERRALMLAFASRVRQLEPELRALMTAENGTPFNSTAGAPKWVAELFEYNAGFADKIGGKVISTFPGPAFDYTLDEPYGVVAVIVPWNGPFVSFGQVLAPALAAGNTIVIKPAELAPYTNLRLAEIAHEVGFPPGVINVVPGGAVAGTALTSHPGVNKIFFTGSGATASKIIAATAPNLTPTGFELGGKSARLVFDDADLDTAVLHSVSAVIGLSGQACIAGTRVLVQAAIYDEVVERAIGILESVSIGDPQSATTVMGPVISQGAVDRIMGFIDRAQSSHSGRLVTGGVRLDGEFADGYFIRPTIFADVRESDEIAQQEIFGPVQAFMKFDSESEGIALANNTAYGLAAYIETTDVKRAHRVAQELDSGTVWINGFQDLPVGAPFGGVKSSGFGRLGGEYAIQEFTQPKNVWMRL